MLMTPMCACVGGGTLREAFEQVALCMFNYMTPLEGIEARDVKRFSMYGDDMDSLMFHWLDELLFTFSTEFFVPRKLRILEFDTKNWKIQAEGYGMIYMYLWNPRLFDNV